MSAALPPMDAKQLVAFTNKFVREAVQLLNRSAGLYWCTPCLRLCLGAEERMMTISRKLSDLEDSLGEAGDRRIVSSVIFFHQPSWRAS